MEETKPRIGKYSFNYGLLLGLASIVFTFMLYTQGLHYEQKVATTIISILLTLGAVFLGVNAYKKANGGYLKMSDALKIGVGVALISTIVYFVFQYVLTTYIEPDFWDKAMEIAKTKTLAANPKMTDEQWQQGVEMQKKFRWLMYPIGIIINCVIGLVIGLVVGLIKRNAPQEY